MVAEFDSIKLILFEKSGIIEDKIISNILSFIDKPSLADVVNLNLETLQKVKGLGPQKIDNILLLSADIQSDPNKYIDYYRVFHTEIILPDKYSPSDDLVHGINIFFQEYLYLLIRRNEEKKAEILRKYFSIDTASEYSIPEIAQSISKTNQRVDQIVMKESGLKELLKGESVNNITLNPALLAVIRSISASVPDTSFPDLTSSRGWSFQKTQRILWLLNLDLAEINNRPIVVERDAILRLTTQYTEFIQELKQSVFPLDPESVCNDTRLINLFRSISEFEIFQNEEGKISLAWKYLSSINNKVQRIVFEAGKPMSRREILNEYNLRLQKAGEFPITDDEFKIKRTEDFYSQPNGYWQFGKSPNVKLFDFIELFIKSRDGKVTVADVIDAAENNGYIYPDKTYKAYIQKVCLQSKSDKNIYIHKDYLSHYPNIDVRDKKKYGVANWVAKNGVLLLKENGNQLSTKLFIDSLFKQGVAEKMIERRGDMVNYVDVFFSERYELWEISGDHVKLNEDKLNEYDLNKIGLKTEPEYKSVIRALVINHLKSKKGFKESRNNLFRLFSDQIPAHLKKNIFYKILNDNEYFSINDNDNVQLSVDLLPEPEYLIADTQPPVQISQIENKPIPEIDNYSRKIFEWSTLKPKLFKMLQEYEYSFQDNEINTGLDIMYNKMIDSFDSRFSRVFQSLFELTFYKTDDFDRETHLLWITLGYEPFLKKFWKENKPTEGLYDVINTIGPVKELSGYNHLCKDLPKDYIDFRKKKFSNYLDTLKYFRKKYSHDLVDTDLNLSMFKQVQIITHFLAVYVYTALILGEKTY